MSMPKSDIPEQIEQIKNQIQNVISSINSGQSDLIKEAAKLQQLTTMLTPTNVNPELTEKIQNILNNDLKKVIAGNNQLKPQVMKELKEANQKAEEVKQQFTPTKRNP